MLVFGIAKTRYSLVRRGMRKEYRPMALGFWGIGVPLVVFAVFFCRTPAQRLTVSLSAAVFLIVGALIYRAKQ
jgi:hypothetical protein